MYSGRVELGELPPANDNMKHENICCVKLSAIKEEQCHLSNFTEETCNAEVIYHPESFISGIPSENMLHTLSGLYAQLLIVLTATIIFAEVLHGHLPLFYFHDYLFLYLLGLGTLLLIGAFINKFRERCFQVHIRDLVNMPQYLSKKLVGEVNKLDIDQFFKAGIHVFGLGVLISNGLEVISTFMSPASCLTVVSKSQSILRCIFIAFQVAFFMMSSKEIWNIFGCLRNLSFMHLLATNVSLWIRLLLWESAKDWETSLHVKHNSTLKWEKNELNFTVHSLESDYNSDDSSKHHPNHVIHYTSNCWWRTQKDEVIDVLSVQNCLENSTFGKVWSRTNEFLYLIMAQYYFLIFCVLYVIWINFNSKRSDEFSIDVDKRRNDNICSKSTKGLFLGVIILFTSIVIMIIHFSVENDSRFIVRILYCVIFASSAIAAVLGIIQSKNMQVREPTDIYYDNFLQSSGLLAVYIYSCCNIIKGASSNEEMSFVLCLQATFMIVHASVQNMFVSQISRKKIDDLNVSDKPARQAVVFLLLCNISLWILECFVSWNLDKTDFQLDLLGKVAWPLMTRMVFPFLVFYRYHSSVSLFKIWKKSYS